MKNLLSFLFIVFIFLFSSCDKEDEPKETIKITSETVNVSSYGASDGAIYLSVTGGRAPFTYLWSNGVESKNLQNIPVGNYSVSVTDLDGDKETYSTEITQPTLTDTLKLEYEIKKASATDASDGSISLTISGGIEPYTISWSNGSTESQLSKLIPGIYTVDVSDAGTQKIQEQIEVLSILSISFQGNNVSSYNGADGSIDLQVSGGKSPYTIEWSNGSNSEGISGLQAGQYKVTVTDANSNKKQASTILYETFDLNIPEAKILENVSRLKQSGLRIENNNQIIYVDPISILAGHESDADIILITHNHSDHFDAGIVGKLADASTILLCPANMTSMLSLAVPSATVLQIAPDSVKTVHGIKIDVVPAYNSNHSLPNSVGYILTLDGIRFYHSGDTKRIPEMTEFNVDIACIPLGQTYTFSSIEEAVLATKDLGASVVLPIHYGLYEGKDSDPWIFKTLLVGEIPVCIKPVK